MSRKARSFLTAAASIRASQSITLSSLIRERDEYALGYVFSKMRIANHAERGRIDEIHMAAHQNGERRFGAVFSVGAQQL